MYAAPEGIALLFPQSKNLQRLGSLAVLVKLVSPTRASSVGDVARNYRSVITSRVTVPANKHDEVMRYLAKRNLSRKYGLAANPLVVEAQDWLLSDPELPSRTGSEKEEVTGTVDLACQLGLVWPTSCQRTWAGNLLSDNSPDLVSAFRNGLRVQNPFKLSVAQRTILAFLVLTADRSFLAFLVKHILALSSPVSIPDLIACIQYNFNDFLVRLRERAKTPDDRAALKTLDGLGGLLTRRASGRKAAAGGVTVQTIRRTYEELLYWRLEALVDLAYLTKPDPDGYSYVHAASLRRLSAFLDEAAFSEQFFQHCRELFGDTTHPVDIERARELLQAANEMRANSMGYTLIQEGTLTANLTLLDGHCDEVLELGTAIAAVQKGSDSRYKVLASVDRNRNLSAYKIQKI